MRPRELRISCWIHQKTHTQNTNTWNTGTQDRTSILWQCNSGNRTSRSILLRWSLWWTHETCVHEITDLQKLFRGIVSYLSQLEKSPDDDKKRELPHGIDDCWTYSRSMGTFVWIFGTSKTMWRNTRSVLTSTQCVEQVQRWGGEAY